MKTYKVDLDYESFLFDPGHIEDSPQSQKTIKEFEYVFFLIQKERCCLKNSKKYQPQYLEHLNSLNFTIPEFDSAAKNYEYWWSHRHDTELERKLNSKITSVKVAQKLNCGFFEGAIVHHLNEVKTHLDKYPRVKKWILKKPDSFSGKGHYQFQVDSMKESFIANYIQDETLLEPYYERVFDIGTTFVLDNGKVEKSFMVENFNTASGSFRGGVGCASVDKFKKYIFEKYNFSLEVLEVATREIVQEYVDMGALYNVQIDSFIYRDGDQLKLYPLVEVNYRKTMGLVIQALAEKFPNDDFVEWRVETQQSLKEKPMDQDWIKLSPDDNYFKSYFKRSSRK